MSDHGIYILLSTRASYYIADLARLTSCPFSTRAVSEKSRALARVRDTRTRCPVTRGWVTSAEAHNWKGSAVWPARQVGLQRSQRSRGQPRQRVEKSRALQ